MTKKIEKVIIDMDYKALLEHSYGVEAGFDEPAYGRLEYLSSSIFEFTAENKSMHMLFTKKAIEVCAAIVAGTTLKYASIKGNRQWYYLMCNMPFFASRIDSGNSIGDSLYLRKIQWCSEIEYSSTGLWVDGNQLHQSQTFSRDAWERFICAVIEFAMPEMKTNKEILALFGSEPNQE